MESKANHNIGKLFYKDYYKNLKTYDSDNKEKNDSSHIKKINDFIFQSTINSSNNINIGNESFKLTTIYPGLLVGSGYNHEIPGVDEQLKLGFYFDYTSGLPVIPGSSVKGVLRSVFPGYSYQQKKYTNHNHKAREEYIKDILGNNKVSKLDINKLEYDLFEGIKNIDAENDRDKYYPISQRDIFFDAVIVKSENENNIFLADDYITPHKDPLKNPNPIKFLKVLPRVTFKFQFYLTDSIITAEDKLKLFKQILLDQGIGAKTAVGYGYFKDKHLEN